MRLEPFGPALDNPAGLAMDADGHVWVAEWGASQVVRLSPAGDEVERLAGPGRGAGELNGPVHVAFGPAGEVYVADWGNDRVQRLRPAARVWGEVAGSEPLQFRHAAGLAVGPDGRVFIGDAGNNRIQVLSPDGELVAIWEGFDDPGGLTLHDGSLFVVEGRAHRVTRIDDNGAAVAFYGSPEIFNSPHAVGFDSHANMYVADTKNHAVQVLDASGAQVDSWGAGIIERTFGLAVADDRLFVSDFTNGRLWAGPCLSRGG